uniref:RNase_Zc3h12a domain-containing protein n=1 Tax=Anopheles dirus TaxID=7168 RepID=A0A182MY17_9DIPT
MVVNSRKPSTRDRHKTFDGRKSIRSRRTPPKSAITRQRSASLRVPRPAGKPSPRIPPSTRLAITDLDIPPENRRLVICDGENICYNDITDEYLSERLRAAVEWFQEQGFQVLMLCPDYLPDKLIGYDHRFIEIEYVSGIPDRDTNHSRNEAFEAILLRRAHQNQAAVVSERSFANTYHQARDVVLERVIGFTFFKSSIFIPVDPYGRAGPWLRVILRK